MRRAWAKVNLTLAVTGRRADGYHELDSLIVFAGVGDTLVFEPDDELRLEVEGPFAAAVPAGADNLIARAARALAASTGREAKARVRLDKRLPAAAGIGGGSADAAATLDGLARLWGLDSAEDELARIALGLGADVPVCRYGRPALVRGIGELIERAPPLPAAWLVLANPGVALATAEVFAALGGRTSQPRGWGDLAPDARSLAARLAERANDLEAPARQLAPAIDLVLKALAEQPGCLLARLSGSGATCFGLFAEVEAARSAAAALGAGHGDWWVAEAPILHGKLDRHWRD